MSFAFEQIAPLLQTRGADRYGSEAVSQLEHALQCAALAEQAGSSPELITAALLHDFGHLMHDLDDDPAERGIDDVHQYMALPFLRPLFPDAVLEPIRLHVDAKRFLCTVEANYWESLSPASKLSLELQGGRCSPQEVERFMRLEYALDAIKLRRWDDLAKVKAKPTPELAHFVEVMRGCCKQLQVALAG